jgi:hypothetical protein
MGGKISGPRVACHFVAAGNRTRLRREGAGGKGSLCAPLPNVAKNPAKTTRGHSWSADCQPEDCRSPLTGRMRLKEAESSAVPTRNGLHERIGQCR